MTIKKSEKNEEIRQTNNLHTLIVRVSILITYIDFYHKKIKILDL